MNIRPATTKDYTQIANIRNLIYPDYHETAEKYIESDKNREKKIKYKCWVAEIDGKVVAEAVHTQQMETYHPNKFSISIVVLPEYQNRGIGSALYRTVTESLEQYDPIKYQAMVQDNLPSGISFLTKQGFAESIRDRISYLDVQAFDETKFDDLKSKLQEQDITFKSLPDERINQDYAHRLYELEWELVNDIPDFKGELSKQTFDEWLKSSLNHPELIHDAYHIAFKDGVYIGYSYLWGGSDGRLIHTGMTGVKKDFRRTGVATYLKVLGIKYAKDNGFNILWTCNTFTNVSILSVNETLGFKKQYETIVMVKILREENN